MNIRLKTLFLPVTFFSIFAVISNGIGNCFALAPDEELYFRIFSSTYTSSIYSHPEAWVEGSDFFFRIIFFPAKFFSIIPGVSDLNAFRFGSILYLILGVVFITKAAQIASGSISPIQVKPFIYLINLLVPTALIWSSLGLKENLVIFSYSLICAAYSRRESGSDLFRNFLYSTAYLLLLNTKIYLAYFTFIVMLIVWIYNFMKNKSRSSFNFRKVALYLPLLAPLIFQITHFEHSVSPFSQSNYIETAPLKPINSSNDIGSRTLVLLKQCDGENQGGWLISKVNPFLIHASSKDYKPSPIRTDTINPGRAIQPLKELPRAFESFIFYPEFWKVPTTFFGKLQWLNSLIFFIILIGAFWCIFTCRKYAKWWVCFLCLNLIGLIVLYSLTEVNFGTLSRHRLVLSPFIMACYSTYILRKTSEKL